MDTLRLTPHLTSPLHAAVAATLMGLAAMHTPPADAQPLPHGAAQAQRHIEFNGQRLDAAGLLLLRAFEAQAGTVPDGRYWYDRAAGGAGVWGGPAIAWLGPGLALGGPLPANASGGGHGRLTGVFVNGRELHPIDVQGLMTVVPVQRGRFWWDAAGNVGVEGGPPLFNFYAVLAQQRASGGGFHHRANASRGESTYVGKGCAAVHGRLRSSDEGSGYSYYVGC